LRRIIHRSFAAAGLDRAELFRLLYHARVANESRGLSGVLLHSDNRLLQVLEGPTWKLTAVFDKIRRDPRHRAVEVIDESSIGEMTFPQWAMRYFNDRSIGKAMPLLREAGPSHHSQLIERTVREFFVEGFATPCRPILSPPEAALPSFPRPC
jgi:hypothetical protein